MEAISLLDNAPRYPSDGNLAPKITLLIQLVGQTDSRITKSCHSLLLSIVCFKSEDMYKLFKELIIKETWSFITRVKRTEEGKE